MATSMERGRKLLASLKAAGFVHEDPRHPTPGIETPEWAVYIRGTEFAESVYLHIGGPDGDYTVRVSDHRQATNDRGRVVGGWTPNGRHDAADVSIHPGSGLSITKVAREFAAEIAKPDGTIEAAIERLSATEEA